MYFYLVKVGFAKPTPTSNAVPSNIETTVIPTLPQRSLKLELMFMKHYAPNRCLYIKVAKLRTGVGSAEMSHLQIAISKYI